METTYRVLKLTRLNKDTQWVVQKQFKNWITRKLKWKYLASYAADCRFSSFISDAELFYSEKSALDKMNNLIKQDCGDIVDTEVVKTVTSKKYEV